MNPGQMMFQQFLMDRVKDDKKDEAKALLTECFAKQDAGTFDRAFFESITPKLFEFVKPEAVEELKQAMAHFGSRL